MNQKLYRYLFYIILFILTYLFYIFPFEILSQYLLNETTSYEYSIINTVIFFILIVFYLRSHNTFKPLKIFVYEGLGIGFISFLIISISLLINSFSSISQKSIGVMSLIIIMAISIYGMLNARRVLLKKITIKSSKINKNYNIIFISDVHLGTNTSKHLSKILNKIKTLEYDFLLIGGDLIDSSSFKLNDLNLFNKIKKDIYFVNGNHEYYLKGFKNKIEQLKKFKIKVLKNSSMQINEINLIGIDDLQSKHSKIKFVEKLNKKNVFNLVLSHKPDIWDNIKSKNDLMLSGHTHNGQIFPFNFLVKLKFKFIYGIYEYKKSKLYVSSGVGCWGPKLRIGSSNEIINIQLTKIT
jgi:predicted MPP superfamily phosphohydrolase